MGMTGHPNMSRAAMDAVFAHSMLAALPPAVQDVLIRDAMRVELPAGTTLYYQHEEPGCALVLHSVVRVYIASSEGRQITIRYARPRDGLGRIARVTFRL